MGSAPTTGNITINSGGALNVGGDHATVAAWLATGMIVNTSTGALALTDDSDEDISMAGYDSLSLGAAGNYEYTGALTPVNNTYRLGGGGGTLTIPNALSGARSVVVNGNVTLTGTHTYSNGTTIYAGTLQLGDGTTDGSVAGDITDDARLVFANAAAQAFSGEIDGDGSLTKIGPGALTLSGTNGYLGGTAVSGGQLVFAGGALGQSGTIAIAGNATLRWSSGNTEDISGRLAIQASVSATLDVGGNTVVFGDPIGNDLANPGSLIKAGAGTLSLAGSDRFQSVTIDAGTLQVADASISTLNYGDIANYGSLVFDCGNDLNVGGAISGTGSVIQQGSGTLIFTGTNDYSGGTTINAGTLLVGAEGSAGTSVTLTAQLSANVSGRAVTFIDETASLIIGTAVTNSLGIASINYVLTQNAAPGRHDIRAVCGDSSQTAPADVTPGSLLDWSYRKQITISNAHVDADLTNFPVCVEISNESDIGASALLSGNDIRFTASDGVTLLKYERESWSGGAGSPATATFWVRVPTVGHGSNTTIYIYYGNSGAADGQDPTAVWDSNFKGVWHLGENAANHTAADSTNGNNATAQQNTSVLHTTGTVDGAFTFNGSTDYVDPGAGSGLDGTSQVTVSFWFQDNAPSQARLLLTRSSGSYWGAYFVCKGAGASPLYFKVRDASGNFSNAASSPGNLSDSNWHLFTGVYDGSCLTAYVDGVAGTPVTGGGSLYAGFSHLFIGGTSSGGYTPINGAMDEVEISDIGRSAAWVKFQYANTASATNELTWSTEQTNQGIGVSALTTSASLAAAGTAVTLTAQLSGSVSGRVVTFTDDTASTTIGTAVTDGSGTATMSYSLPAVASLGPHTIRASYNFSSQTTTVCVSSAVADWSYRKQITISSANVDADLTNFPLYVKISNDADIGASALVSGYDIRFTASDGVTLLDYERESWSGGGGSPATGNFWVKAPTIGSWSNTTIYIYYGNSGAADGQNPTAVWDSNFKGVWHLGENAANHTAADSTNGNNAAAQQNTSVLHTTGTVDGAFTFNGSTDCIDPGAGSGLDGMSQITVSFWFQDNAPSQARLLLTRSSGSYWGAYYIQKWSGNYPFYFTVKYASGSYSNAAAAPRILSDSNWHLFTGVYDGSYLTSYVDGVAGTPVTGSGSLYAGFSHLFIGGTSSGGYTPINGAMDEVEISNIGRSAAWVKFQYANTASATNELSWSSQESNQPFEVGLSALAVNDSPAVAGAAVTLTARLSSSVSGERVSFVDETASTTIGTAITDASGTATITYSVPAAASLGSHILRAAHGTSSATTAMVVTALSVSSLVVSHTAATTGTLGSGDVANNGSLIFNRTASSTVTVNGLSGNGTIRNDGAAVTLSVGGNNQTSAFSGTIQDGSGTVALLKTGAEALTLSGANTYTGGTTVSAGTLSLGSANAIGTSGTIALTGGTLQFTSSNTTDYSSRFSTAAGQIYRLDTNGQSVTLAGALTSSAGALTKLGSGTLTLRGNNTYDGGTTVSAGTLQLGSAGALSTGGLTVGADGTVDLNGNSVTVYTLSGSAGATITDSTGTGTTALTVSVPAGTSTFSGVIENGTSCTVALTKSGSGTLTLTGANTYTGATTVDQGTLCVTGSISNSDVTVDAGGIFSGTGTTRNMTVNGSLNPGFGPTGTIHTNTLSVDGGQFNVDITAGGWDQIIVADAVTLTDATLDLTNSRTRCDGKTFVIIKNNGGNSVSGTFADLSEGSQITEGDVTFAITYCYNADTQQFGTGNDVALYVPLKEPDELDAGPVSASEIDLSWNDRSDNETGYNIQRSVDGENWGSPTSLGANAHSFPDKGLAEGITYYYRVCATRNSTDSEYSDVVSATTLPAAPTEAQLTAISAGSVSLIWQDISELESGYAVEQYVYVDSHWQWQQIGQLQSAGSTSAMIDGTFQPSARYCFRVRAYQTLANGTLYSLPSGTVWGIPVEPVDGGESVDEGSAYTLTFSTEELSANPNGVWDINWGDGHAETVSVSVNSPSVTHTYTDGPARYTVSAAASSSPWVPDGTFGNAGEVVGDWDQVVLQPDGKIIVGGDAPLSRYDKFGSPDAEFGTGGQAGYDGSKCNRILLQPDGKIVALFGSDGHLVRFNADGALDEGFGDVGDNGIVTAAVYHPSPSGASRAVDAALMPDGSIIVVGQDAQGYDWMEKFNVDGELDTSFPNGMLYTCTTQCRRVVQSGGSIIVMSASFGAVRYTAAGRLDASFHCDSDPSPGNPGVANDIIVQPDGKIIEVGSYVSIPGTEPDLVMRRYTAEGAPDSTFGTNGTAFYDYSGGNLDEAFGVALQPDGKIVVGLRSIKTPGPAGIARYKSDGSHDTTFYAPNGIIPCTDAGPAANGVAIQPDGKILLVMADGGLVRIMADAYPIARTVTVHNVAPTVTVPEEPVSQRGVVLNLAKLATFSDPGFDEPLSTPPTSETFTYTVNWGDGATASTGAATIDVAGGPDVLTRGDVPASHTYTTGGCYTVTVTVTDDDQGSDTKSFQVNMGVVNAPPRFTSRPIVDAYVGTPYDYHSTASDPDGDPLEFSLGDTVWPQGFTPANDFAWDSETGVITWDPPAELVGKTVTIRETVSDGKGDVSRPITIMVHEAVGNHDPLIVSEPSRQYLLPTPDSPTGSVVPDSLEFSLAAGQSKSFPVCVSPSPYGVLGADIVFIVDESDSMGGSFSPPISEAHQWIAAVVPSLEAQLRSRGCAVNRYALVGFGLYNGSIDNYPPHVINVGNGPFGDADEFATAAAGITLDNGNIEDGYWACDTAMSLSDDFRSNAIVEFVLVTDENRCALAGAQSADFEAVLNELKREATAAGNEVVVQAVVAGTLCANVPGSGGGDDTDFELVADSNNPVLAGSTSRVAPLAYTLIPGSPEGLALSVLDHPCVQNPNETVCQTLDASITVADDGGLGGQAFVIFDYESPDNFRFAGLDTVYNDWIIGSVDAGQWNYSRKPARVNSQEDSAYVDLKPGVTYELSVQLHRATEGSNDTLATSLLVDGLPLPAADQGSVSIASPSYVHGVGASGCAATFGYFAVGSVWGDHETSGLTSFATSFGGTDVLGINYDHQAWLFGEGKGNRGELVPICTEQYIADLTIRDDYALLAWQTKGAIWSIDALRGSDSALQASFAAALADSIAARWTIHPVIEGRGAEGVGFSYVAGSTFEQFGQFDVTFEGDGSTHVFDLKFYSSIGGDPLGSIPVAIAAPYVYPIVAVDPDGDSPLQITWTDEESGHHGAVLRDGTVTWEIPSLLDGSYDFDQVLPDNAGTPPAYDFSVTVSDGHGGTAVQSWTVVVQHDDPEDNHAPAITPAAPPDAMEQRAWSFAVMAEDADHDTLRYDLVPDEDFNPPPLWMRIDHRTGVITGTPPLGSEGDCTFLVRVTDGRGGKCEQLFGARVNQQTMANSAPRITSAPPRAAYVGTTYHYQVVASDPDGDRLTYSLD